MTLKRHLISNNQSKGGYSEFYEQTPLVASPLIKEGPKYYCFHPYILYRCVEHFIYNTLKADDPKWFMDNFSGIYERYLETGLKYSSLKFYSEKDLIKNIDRKSKCVDYLIFEDSNIFIDAKAVEMPYLGKVSDDPDVILGKIKNTALKAIEQAYELNSELLTSTNKTTPKFKEESYLLVVTYKELYIGSGKALQNSVAKEKIDKLIEKTDPKAVVPLENIYFITIDDFDALMSAAKNGESISDIINTAISHDKVAEHKKFHFKQHITSILGESSPLPYLMGEADRIIGDHKVRLGENDSYTQQYPNNRNG